MTFHQAGKVSEQKSSPAASSFGPGMTAALLLPSVGEQQKRSNNKPSINHIPDAQVPVAPRWPPSLSEHRKMSCAARTPRKSCVRSCPGDRAGCAGTGEQQVTLSSGRRARRAVAMQAEPCSRLASSGGLPPCFPPKPYPWWLSFGGEAGTVAGGQHSSWAAAFPRPLCVLQSTGSAGSAGDGASKPCRASSPGHCSCVEQPWHGGNLLVS